MSIKTIIYEIVKYLETRKQATYDEICKDFELWLEGNNK